MTRHERLAQTVRRAHDHALAWRARLDAAGIDPARVRSIEDLDAMPVLHKEDLVPLQAADRPFGGLLGQPVGEIARLFMSPGPIYDPEGAISDYWRFGPALKNAGIGRGDVVMVCFNYHLSPAGFMFDSAARALGAAVVPAGIGQMELQARLLSDLGVTGYGGLPSYLAALLDKAKELGGTPRVRAAVVSGEMLPESLRARLKAEYGITMLQAYGTADVGCVSQECGHGPGQHVNEGVIVEICDPQTGVPLPAGEVGEVVVTLLSPTYPLLRFGTGDLSAWLAAPGTCTCGDAAPRLRGVLGRCGDAVKVRGMFVHPSQLAAALADIPGLGRWHARVTRSGDTDALTLRCEGGDAALIRERVREATRIRAEVELVAPGSVAEESHRKILDERRWE